MIAFLLSGLLAAADPAAASPSGSAVRTTDITCDASEIQSTDAQTITVCEGHVVVLGTNLKVTCDHLKVVSVRVSEKSGIIGQQNGLKSLLATGHVHLLQNGGVREATCGRAEVFPTRDLVVLTETPRVVDHGNNWIVTGDVLNLHRDQRRVDGTNVHFTLPPVRDLGFSNQHGAEPAPSAGAPSSQ